MTAVSLGVVLLAFVIFGLFGGFMLLVGLNGFTSKQAEPVFLVYTVLVTGGATLVAFLLNWLIIRRGFPAAGLPAWAGLFPAAALAFLLLAVPALFFIYV
jgi:hypothetical protein